MEVKFIYEGIEGIAKLTSETPNCYGNICAEITWGGLFMAPTFRSKAAFLSFMQDEYELGRLIDEAAHTPDLEELDAYFEY